MSTTNKILIGLGVLGVIGAISFIDSPAKDSLPTSLPASESALIKEAIPSEKPSAKKPIIQKETAQEAQNSNCHPNYSGCLKADASDYDCAGGSGNGPYYTGKVRVIGRDVFGLDRDGDGWGCE